MFRTASVSALVLSLSLLGCAKENPTPDDPDYSVTAPDAARSIVTVDPASGVAADGKASSKISVQIRNADDRPLSGQVVSVSVSGSGNTVTQSATPSDASGAVQATVVSTTPEEKKVVVVVNAGGVSPVTLLSQPTIKFVTLEQAALQSGAAVDKTLSSFTASPRTGLFLTSATPRADKLDETTLRLQLRNSKDEPIANRSVTIEVARPDATTSDVYLDGGAGASAPTLTKNTDSSGVITTTLRSLNSGIHTVKATIKPGAGEGDIVMERKVRFNGIFDSSFSDRTFSALSATLDAVRVANLDGDLSNGLELVLAFSQSVADGPTDYSKVEIYRLAADGSIPAASAPLDSFSAQVLRTDELAVAPGLAVGDFDGDGTNDLAVANHDNLETTDFGQGNDYICTYRNAGGSDFGSAFRTRELQDSGGDSREPVSLAMAQIDGKGGLDVVAAFRGGEVRLETMTALADFDQDISVFSSGAAEAVAVGDLNLDGWVDLVTLDSGSVEVRLNQIPTNTANNHPSDPIFRAAEDESISGASVDAIAVGDLNGDSKPDLVRSGNPGGAAVYLGLGDGNLGSTAVAVPGGRATSEKLAIADVNADGLLDLIVAPNNTVEVWLNSPGL